MKNDARTRYTEKVIKESFLKLLAKKDINKITVKELCEVSMINRATFYSHYHDIIFLLKSLETDIIESFKKSLVYINSFDVSELLMAIYDMIDENYEIFKLFIKGNTNSQIIKNMIDIARENSINHWKKLLKNASLIELDMLYIHLSNGLMHVIVEAYDKYKREDVANFINKIAKASMGALF